MAQPAIKDRDAMVSALDPALMPGRFAFITRAEPEPDLMAAALATCREAEGISLIVPASLAPEAMAMRQITLQVHSALDGVGLTAAVAAALTAAAIPANVVAAFHHDHLFVPEALAERALDVLRRLAADQPS
ncbi:MAG: ACT domain-containing protein [Pseudomonadota bacterium]